MPISTSNSTQLLPVTLLSGFLGSGKTTLLQHILRNKQGLKCAVIVNDMASINIDASLISNASLIQKDEQLVQFQNGCICCTLRGDLLVEISRLADSGEFDYLVIESTGISEPMQVAETFAMTAEELHALEQQDQPVLQSLVGKARLDTCVSVVDVSNFFTFFDEAKFLSEKFDNVEQQDDRTVTELLCDQIEFANVILLNKIDVALPSQLQKCRDLIERMNPSAIILESNYSKVDLKGILNTTLFDMQKASHSAGWLQSLSEKHVPETEEYGIGSFIFRSRRPFHPQRLYDLLAKYFMVIEIPDANFDGMDEEDEEMDENEEMDETIQDESSSKDENNEMDDNEWQDQESQEMPKFDQKQAQKRSKQKQKSAFANVFRSKGFIWIATRPKSMGEWSQSGMIVTISNAGNWFSELDKEYWPQDEKAQTSILQDFDDSDPLIGDKRQELVFIGQFQTHERKAIEKQLGKCLLTDREWKKYLDMDMESWSDPWEDWEYLESSK